MRILSSLAICCGLCLPLLGAEDITIRNANTDNPTLLYKHKPMLKTGPISEDRVFMYTIGSDFFDHEAWFDYMKKSGFGFARVYAAHTWNEDQRVKSTKPLHPFEIRRYTKEGGPCRGSVEGGQGILGEFFTSAGRGGRERNYRMHPALSAMVLGK